MDWDFVFAQLKRFYRCSKAEYKAMTLYELFELLEDGAKLVKAEGGEKGTGEKNPSRPTREELANAAKRRKIKLPRKGL